VGQIGQRGQSLDIVLAELYEARGDIFDNIFSRSWNLLSEDARQVLMVMPIFATSASRAGIDAASNVHHFALDEALGQLVEMSLVDATDELDLSHRRYGIHPLTRAFATKKGESEPEIQKAAQERLAKFFQSFANKHGGIWNEEGFAQLGPELPNILALTKWCWEQRLPSIGLNIFRSIADFLLIRGHWSDAMELGQQAVAIAADLGDESRTAFFRVWPIGWLNRHRGELNSAEEEVKQALAMFERLNEEEGIALAKRNLGRIFQERGELEQAERLLSEAFALEQPIGCERRIYLVTANLADVALDKGDLDTAWALCNSVLASARRFGHPTSIARLLKALGRVAHQRGDLEQAKSFWKEALAYMKRASRRDEMADCRYWLARLEIEAGDELTASELFSKALETYRRLGIQSKARDVEARLEKLSKPIGYEE
jgi:tetratricopeptide (TPR) repeat protein